MVALGLGGDAAVLVAGRLGGGAWSGIGPFERNLLLAGLVVALAGIPLLRLDALPAAIACEPHYTPPAKIPGRGWRWAGRILAALAILVYLAYFAVYLTYAADLFRWPYDYDQGESFELYDAVLHSQGEWPYRDSSTFPFYSSNYPPLFHIINVLLFPLFGQTLLSGRVLSFAITLLTAVIIALSVRRRTGGVFIPLICGLSYLASNFVYHIGPLCRQHLTMVFLETLCVYFIAAAEDTPTGRRNLLLGLVCLLLAGYAKQLAVFTAAAVFGYLFLRNPRRALLWMGAFGLIFGLIFLGINLATGGYWWINTISANVNEFMLPQLVALTQSWFKVHALFVLLALGMGFYEAYVGQFSIYTLWFVFALGTGLMSGKWGAGEAYWITSVAAAIILAGFALGKVRDWVSQRHPQWQGAVVVILPLLFLAQSTRMLHLPTAGPVWGLAAQLLGVAGQSAYADYPYYDAVGYSQVGHLMLPRDYEGGARLLAHVRETEGLVFSEEAAFTMLAGKPVITNPTQLLNLYNNGLLNTSELEAMLNREEFGLVIMRAQFYPPPVLNAIGQHYGLVEHVALNGFQYIVMKPLGVPADALK
ncbi:MAG: glycosyltransferase family 39 protein [Anaerolineae bacterium]|nr:glycosyltransferase family 39 protein [Anaerolineae bacterium]